MNYTFYDIAGYEAEKEILVGLCDILCNRKKYISKGGKVPKGIIFYGDAGTGKTLFAKVLADHCGLYTYRIVVDNNEPITKISRKIRNAFESAARRAESTMVFFEDIDRFLPSSDEESYLDQSRKILALLLRLIDNSPSSVTFVATCNGYGGLPQALLQAGRIDKMINIDLPNYSSRVEILRHYLSQSGCMLGFTFAELANLCTGFSCSALEKLVNECVVYADSNNFVSKEIVTEKIQEVSQAAVPSKNASIADTINACRNLGRFIVAKTFNNGGYCLDLEQSNLGNYFFNITLSDYDNYASDGYDDDYDDYDDDDYICGDDECGGFDETKEEKNMYVGKTDLLNTICVLCGGLAAEHIVFNKTYGNTQKTLSYINSILLNMSEQGMFGIENIYSPYRNSKLPYSVTYIEKINALFDKTMLDCYKIAEEIIQKNKKLIKKLIPILLDKGQLTDCVCEPILKELGGIVI